MTFITLDCETLGSGWQSLASIAGVETENLKKYFSNLGEDKCREELMNAFCSNYSMKPIERICWFHLTRVRSDEDFSEGLLPSLDCIERIWQNIFFCLEGTPHYENLKSMKRDDVGLIEFRRKLQDISRELSGGNDNGPYGFLIPPVDSIESKFLNQPEITQWICIDYLRFKGEDIAPLIAKRLTPKIVKFWTRENHHQQDKNSHLLGAVLYHLYNNLFSEVDPSPGCNCCYAGNGREIAYDQIIKVYNPPAFRKKRSTYIAKAILTPVVDFKNYSK